MAQPTARSARPSPVHPSPVHPSPVPAPSGRPSPKHELGVVAGSPVGPARQTSGPVAAVISLDAARAARRPVRRDSRDSRTGSRSRATHLRLVDLERPTVAPPILRLIGRGRDPRPDLDVLAGASSDGPRRCSICGEDKVATAFRGRGQRCTACRPAHQPGW